MGSSFRCSSIGKSTPRWEASRFPIARASRSTRSSAWRRSPCSRRSGSSSARGSTSVTGSALCSRVDLISFRRPSDDEVAHFLDGQEGAPFSYAAVGATARELPAGFNVDRNRVHLGVGDACYERAVTAIRSWTMFDLGWVVARPDRGPVEAGLTVAVVVRYTGLWFLNACRIVYVVDERHRYGF